MLPFVTHMLSVTIAKYKMLPFWKHMLNDFGTQGYIQPFFHSAQQL